jgi:hypothetical protein
MRLLARLVVVGIVCLATSRVCEGALSAGADGSSEPRTGLALSAGGAWSAVHLFGGIHDAGRRTAVLDVQWSRALKVKDNLAFDYLVGIVPLELQTSRGVAEHSTGPLATTPGEATVYGAGVDPVGMGVRFGRGGWRGFARLRGGFRIFRTEVPDPGGSQFNFAATFGVGVLRRIGRSQWLSLGVDLHHVSNGGLAGSNPGINQFVFSIGSVRMR